MTPLLLVPGLLGDSRLYTPQIGAFSGQRPIHIAAIVGHDSVGALAREILDHAPPRFALAGLSMGGIVAMEILAQAPERVEKIALLDTNPKAESAAIQAMRDTQMSAALTGDFTSVVREQMKPEYLTDSPDRQMILDLFLEMALALGPEVFIRQSRALQSRPDQQETLRQCRVPALILCGEDDVLCPIHRHELMRDLIPNSLLEIIKSAGHLPTLEQPEATNAALGRWLTA